MQIRQPSQPPRAPSYAAPEPYPPIQVCEPNAKYAQMLKIDLASPKSELTSLTQYIYQSWQLDQKHPQLAGSVRQIAVVEMHHLDILGQLVVLLGGNPTFSCRQQGRQIIWNGGMVRYSRHSLARMMQDDVDAEEEAIATYTRQIEHIDDPHIKAILQRILLDEELHLKLFRGYLAEA